MFQIERANLQLFVCSLTTVARKVLNIQKHFSNSFKLECQSSIIAFEFMETAYCS
jgi:hypothetical protein